MKKWLAKVLAIVIIVAFEIRLMTKLYLISPTPCTLLCLACRPTTTTTTTTITPLIVFGKYR